MSTQTQREIMEKQGKRHRLINWFGFSVASLPDAEARKRANTTILYGLCIASWALVFSPIYLILGSIPGGLLILVAGMICVGNNIYLKKRLVIRFCSHFLVAIVLATLWSLAIFTGGLTATSMIWLPTVPVIAVLLGGWQVGRWWLLVTIMSVGVMFVLDVTNALPPSDFAGQAADWLYLVGLLGIISCTTWLCVVFDYNTRALHSRLEIACIDAEQASRAKREFLSNMSHEFRTPFGAILGMTELVLETDLTSKQQDYLQTSRRSAESLLTLINEVLDFSTFESGRLELVSVDFDLREEVGNILKSIADRAHQKGLELVWQIAPDVPLFLRGDPGRLRQILLNLTGNAIKFTRQGEVVLSIQKEFQTESDVRLTFFIRDTGVGIPQEKLAAIFAPFEQVDTSTTRESGGIGLGLASTSRLVEAMRGRIWVESELNEGTTIAVQCPFALGKAVASHAEHFSQHLIDVPIVVVDDHPANRLILREMLTAWGMRVQTTEDATKAIEALLSQIEEGNIQPLLIADVLMPGIDGFELAKRIRSHKTLNRTRIILLTSQVRHGDIARYEELGIQAHLMKPVKHSELFSMLCELLSGKLEPTRRRLESDTKRSALKVLLVEDSVANQKLVTGLLKNCGHEVVLAENGSMAIMRWQQQEFDVILMDLQMPVMDGFEATRQIRQRESQGHIPIIAMTARGMAGDRELCRQAGMDSYISKPLHREELAGILNGLFSEQSGSGEKN